MGIFRSRDEQWPIRRIGEDRFVVELPGNLLDLLGSAGGDVADALDPTNPAMGRLFPPASTDADVDRSYQDLLHDELATSRRTALRFGSVLVEGSELSEEELVRWMQGLNALRLVLGTRLGITEDDDPDERGSDEDDPDAAVWGLYSVLSWIVDLCTRALTESLPPPTQT